MTLAVEAGTFVLKETYVSYVGGNSPTVTAPVSNNRIDVLTIDTSGTLAWVTGTSGASPSAPTVPQGKLPICFIYVRSTSTTLRDTDGGSATGYVYQDLRPFLAKAQTVDQVKIAGSTSGIITIVGAATAGTWQLTLPTDDGSSGQYLQTDGNGVCSWATVAAGGGSWQFVQSATFSVTSTGVTWVDLFSITGLAGDTDWDYKLFLITDDASEYGSGTGYTEEYGLKLNNSTSSTYYWTNYACISTSFAIWQSNRTDNGSISTNRPGNSSGRNYFMAELTIKAAKTTLNGYTTRGWHGISSNGQSGGTPQLCMISGSWGDVTNQITDIRVQAYNIDNTSPTVKGRYVLYKIKTS